MIGKWQISFIFCLLLLLGCSQQPVANNNGSSNQQPVAVEQITAVSVPPTFTPLSKAERLMTAQPQVTVTQNPLPTVATDTPVPFGETAVELRYTIPSIGLDRRLQGNVSSQIIIANEATGDLVKRDNQAGVLIELQQLLPNLELEPIPDGCQNCVYVSYILPFSEQSGAGWLKDRSILASIETYLALSLGPHFPQNTVVGLRRGASPYAPAHTIAISADGLQHMWFATDAEIASPVPVAPHFFEILNQLELEQLGQQYQVTCAGTPLETLFIKNEAAGKWVNIRCPEYSLPTTLLPLYMILDEIAFEKIANNDNTEERPPSLFPLNGLLDYKRVDGAQLTIFHDGTAVALSPTNQTITTTLSNTDVMSLTSTLLVSNQLKLGLTSFLGDSSESTSDESTPTAIPARSVLLVRGSNGVYDGFWDGTANVPILEPLNVILNQLIGDTTIEESSIEETDEETDIEGTPSPEITITPTLTNTVTPEP